MVLSTSHLLQAGPSVSQLALGRLASPKGGPLGAPPFRSLASHLEGTAQPVAEASAEREIWVVHPGSFQARSNTVFSRHCRRSRASGNPRARACSLPQRSPIRCGRVVVKFLPKSVTR